MSKVTKKSIAKKIIGIEYINVPDTTVTICHLTLENGFSVRGESACVDPRNFDSSIGEHYAYEEAFNKVWAFEGYLLAEKLYRAENAKPTKVRLSISVANQDTVDGRIEMTFGAALEVLKSGFKVARRGWNGKGLWLTLQVPDQHSKMTLPYIFMSYPEDSANNPGARVPWLASQTDMLAMDWVIA